LISESGRVISDECGARRVTGRCCTAFSRPNGISKVTTKVGINDNLLVEKVVFNIDAISSEVLNGESPSAWIWIFTVDISWSTGSREAPDFDGVVSPLHSENTSTIVVETGTIV
jgi:hypothetical protein